MLVEPSWLAAAADTFRRYPEAAAIGGPIEPWFTHDPDPGLAEAFPILQCGFCGVNHGAEERAIGFEEQIWGANMAFRMDLVRGLCFNPALGRNGKWLGTGEDCNFVKQVRERGGAVWWSPQMRLKHYVDPARFKLSYLTAYYEGMGESAVREDGNQSRVPILFWVPALAPASLSGHVLAPPILAPL